ncbi:aminotransferase class I/II-fold pyridoxal phosphate-dependent enzyme [Acuticoccus kandeliae]|uniref:aminotransferase class I/II-fold pyridoxal phosphate-dependent enzyme n=1 Tax=Acuticoccus kandeliae TaxID=2073160 RepID=UPI001FE6584D|nr:aminotransferase class I/II-fold pyridoxal phosphate-dependent enzyme [Acuticoccus kandeliae]
MSMADLTTTAAPFKPSARVGRIRPSPSTAAATRAGELKAAGVDLVDLTVGEPDMDTPSVAAEAGIAAIRAGRTRYTPVNGLPELRRAILSRHAADTGIDRVEAEITLGGGGKHVIFSALMAALDPGDEVIIPAPYWVSYPDMVMANDGTPIILTCPQEHGFRLTPGQLEAAITPRTRWLILNNPGNPTGAVYSRAELAALGAVLEAHPHVWVLADEIYDSIWFGEAAPVSFAAAVPHMRDRTLIVNGVSKSHAMTGWRLGWGLGPPPLIRAINTLQSQMSSCPSSVTQMAAVAALSGPQDFSEASRAVYRRRRDLAVAALAQVPGLSVTPSEGAFYLFPNCAGLIGRERPDGAVIANDLDLVVFFLEQGVATIHGAAYGLSPHFRLSIATSDALLAEGCARIAAAAALLR